jgi:hypothetical protein
MHGPNAGSHLMIGYDTHDALPAQPQAVDVGILVSRPSQCNDASCQLNLYEYLAAGLAHAVAAPTARNARVRCAALAAMNAATSRTTR